MRFGPFELDPERFELRRYGELVAIQPKVLELIIQLVRHRDRAVRQDELLATVWSDFVVTKSSLARAISLARRAIGDSIRRPELIVTVPRHGYRFAAPVETAPDSPAQTDPADDYVGRRQMLSRSFTTLKMWSFESAFM